MGPAQFIPSTWAQYKTRIAKISGQNPPNPWDARTAIFAAAMLMADNGADGGTRATERLAALRYLAGWANAGKAAYAFYGNDVMDLADKFQQQIDILGG
jgi:membrane-bound lytic murein transglycosylase B